MEYKSTVYEYSLYSERLFLTMFYSKINKHYSDEYFRTFQASANTCCKSLATPICE